MAEFLIYFIVFCFGIVIGSFLNVLIYRIPLQQEFVKTSSHCMTCGHKLAWYDNIPLFSWISLKGHCRYCGVKLSVQYPVVEFVTGVIFVTTFYINGLNLQSALYCIMFAMLLALSVIDWRTREIEDGFHIVILILAIIYLIVYRNEINIVEHIIGFFAIGLPFWVIVIITNEGALGGGDAKLMAVCGLMLGWKKIYLAMTIGCVGGAIIHLLRMKFAKADRSLAMGPYLSAGIFIVSLWGDKFINWYFNVLCA